MNTIAFWATIFMTDPVGQFNLLDPLITICHSTYTQLGEGAEGQLLDCSLNSYILVGGVPKDIQQWFCVCLCECVTVYLYVCYSNFSFFPQFLIRLSQCDW